MPLLSYKEFDVLQDHRKHILVLLRDIPRAAETLASKLGIDRTSVYMHLDKLLKEGLIEKKKQGRIVFYGLVKKHR